MRDFVELLMCSSVGCDVNEYKRRTEERERERGTIINHEGWVVYERKLTCS